MGHPKDLLDWLLRPCFWKLYSFDFGVLGGGGWVRQWQLGRGAVVVRGCQRDGFLGAL